MKVNRTAAVYRDEILHDVILLLILLLLLLLLLLLIIIIITILITREPLVYTIDRRAVQ